MHFDFCIKVELLLLCAIDLLTGKVYKILQHKNSFQCAYLSNNQRKWRKCLFPQQTYGSLNTLDSWANPLYLLMNFSFSAPRMYTCKPKSHVTYNRWIQRDGTQGLHLELFIRDIFGDIFAAKLLLRHRNSLNWLGRNNSLSLKRKAISFTYLTC